MDSVDQISDMVLGGAFWLFLLVAAFVFGKALLAKILSVLTPRDSAGFKTSIDGALADRLFSLGQNQNGVRRIGGKTSFKATLGLRLGVPAGIFLAMYFYMRDMRSGFEGSFAMEAICFVFAAYYLTFIWAYSVRYDGDKLAVLKWTLSHKEFDLRLLDSLSTGGNGTFKLWFEDGSKIEVLRHITGSVRFEKDMRAVIAANITKDMRRPADVGPVSRQLARSLMAGR